MADFLRFPADRSWTLLLQPCAANQAKCWLIPADDLQHIVSAEYADWLRSVHTRILRPEVVSAPAPSGAQLPLPLPPITLLDLEQLSERWHSPQSRIPLFLLLDLDMTLLLNAKDHDNQVQCGRAHGAHDADFHSVSGGLGVSVRRQAHVLLRGLQERFVVSVLTAGTEAYGQEIVSKANQLQWVSKHEHARGAVARSQHTQINGQWEKRAVKRSRSARAASTQ